jgi:hypothetical protein
MNQDFRIVIATRDSARWLGSLLTWYRRLGHSPLFIVDARTKDHTRDIIKQFGFSYREFLPRGDYPEAGMLEFGAQQSDADWILRLDDDELPNENLLNWTRDIGVRSKNQCWFISRRELFFCQGKVFYSRSCGKYPLSAHSSQLHPMSRLYNKRRVKFQEELHTTGLEDLKLYNFAPSDSFIIHLNCLMRSIQERLDKVRLYESIKPGSTWQLADEYLPELFSDKFHRGGDDGLGEFAGILQDFKSENDFGDLSPEERDLAAREVKRRAHALYRENIKFRLSHNVSAPHVDADAVAWIEQIPRALRRPIARLSCTLNLSKGRAYCQALWNYIQILDRVPYGT